MEQTQTVRTEDVLAVRGYLDDLLASGREGAGYEYEGAYRAMKMVGLMDVIEERAWAEIAEQLGTDDPKALRRHLRERMR